ncbi:SIR2 family protein [Micromonospora sp. NPDC005252]|uniref:SIR2 family NAD-dependent protein deacylase n=1 Tax=Micromonospora sp. NPDC005252 TaxID=3364228 RepID=UPI0036D1CB37
MITVDLSELARIVVPEQTVLLLGAGAAVSSGGPTGAGLAKVLARRLRPSPDGDDLAEIAGIFEHRFGRRELAEAVKAELEGLTPTGGLLALPGFDWRAIYSTNFDRLIEQAYRYARKDLAVFRSNYDFSGNPSDRPVLYKIHGCISQDVGYGHHARMVLTEVDYDEVASYRESLFSSLKQHMMTADTVIVGHSLRDRHLRDLAKTVGGLRTAGVQGRVFLVVYDYNADRAQLLARYNIQVVAGSLDDFLHNLAQTTAGSSALAYTTESSGQGFLPSSLLMTTMDVAHSATLVPDPVRLFHGSPATYADLRAGVTITRAVQPRLSQAQEGARGFFVVLSGAAGVGKTSLARALMLRRLDDGFACWEHLNSFPLDPIAWLEVESRLRAEGRQGVLLIDDCTQHMAAVNKLVQGLGDQDRPHLRLLFTANASFWKTRAKSPYFFSRGTNERISLLTDSDIAELVNLVDRQAAIRALVEAEFLNLGQMDRVRRLRDRCSADMFVCLKNIFQNEGLDNILLQEFAELGEAERDIYRHVAALQAMGSKVHRQLVVRLLGIDAGSLLGLLAHMEGLVSEYDINHRQGVYGWVTRHDVIANVIATWKFSDQSELYALIERLIDGLNPTNHLELVTARSIAAHDMGISRLVDKSQQVELLNRLIGKVPGERIPRRRLIRLFLDTMNLPEADRAISNFLRDIGQDSIVNRYRAVLAMRRAETLPGILEEDRRAMLLEAENLARQCISQQPYDRYNYRTLGQVGLALARLGEMRVLDEAILMMLAAEADIPEPDFSQERRELEVNRRQLSSQSRRLLPKPDDTGTLLVDTQPA